MQLGIYGVKLPFCDLVGIFEVDILDLYKKPLFLYIFVRLYLYLVYRTFKSRGDH